MSSVAVCNEKTNDGDYYLMCYNHLQKQEQSTSCWENTSVLFSQPGESPILFQLGGSDRNISQEGRFVTKKGWNFFLGSGRGNKNFSQKGCYCLAKKEGVRKKAYDRPHKAEEERKFPRKKRSDKS